MRKFRSLFLLLLFLPGISSALTLSEIRTEIRLRIKDTHSSLRRYSDTHINNLTNEAQRDVVNVVWPIKKATTITLVSGTTYYSLPTDLIAIQRVTREFKKIEEVSLEKLDGDFGNSNWESTGGTIRYYFQDPAEPDQIGFYPWPNSSASTGTVKVLYWAQGTTLSADADKPFNSEDRYAPYHDLLIFYVCYRVYLLEGEIEKASIYRQEYESRLVVMRERVGSKPGYNGSFMGGTR